MSHLLTESTTIETLSLISQQDIAALKTEKHGSNLKYFGKNALNFSLLPFPFRNPAICWPSNAQTLCTAQGKQKDSATWPTA